MSGSAMDSTGSTIPCSIWDLIWQHHILSEYLPPHFSNVQVIPLVALNTNENCWAESCAGISKITLPHTSHSGIWSSHRCCHRQSCHWQYAKRFKLPEWLQSTIQLLLFLVLSTNMQGICHQSCWCSVFLPAGHRCRQHPAKPCLNGNRSFSSTSYISS